jgi:hypothetical protein
MWFSAACNSVNDLKNIKNYLIQIDEAMQDHLIEIQQGTQ